MDLEKIFKQDIEMESIASKEKIDLKSFPLVGFAIGIPPIGPNISGDYLLNKHILENIKNNNQAEELIEEEDENEDESSGVDDFNDI
jgi:hypothetical protein